MKKRMKPGVKETPTTLYAKLGKLVQRHDLEFMLGDEIKRKKTELEIEKVRKLLESIWNGEEEKK